MNNSNFYPLLSQVVISGSNFITAIVVAKILDIEDFGVYSLFYVSLMLINGFINTVTTEPMRYTATNSGGLIENEKYSANLLLRLITSTLSSFLIIICLYNFTDISQDFIYIFSISIFMMQVHEFLRVVCASEMKWGAMFTIDLVAHLIKIAALFIFVYLNKLNVTVVFICNGIAYLSTFSCFYLLNKTFSIPSARSVYNTFISNLNFGKWLFYESVTVAIGTQMYVYLIAYKLDVESVAGFNSAQTLVNIMNIIILSTSTYSISKARNILLNQGHHMWREWLVRNCLKIVVVTILVCGVISACSDFLLKTIYTEEYVKYSYLVYILSVSMIINIPVVYFTIYYRTAELPMIGFIAKLSSSIFTLIFSLGLINYYGLGGAAYGVVGANLTCLIVYFVSLHKVDKNKLCILKSQA